MFFLFDNINSALLIPRYILSQEYLINWNRKSGCQ